MENQENLPTSVVLHIHLDPRDLSASTRSELGIRPEELFRNRPTSSSRWNEVFPTRDERYRHRSSSPYRSRGQSRDQAFYRWEGRGREQARAPASHPPWTAGNLGHFQPHFNHRILQRSENFVWPNAGYNNQRTGYSAPHSMGEPAPRGRGNPPGTGSYRTFCRRENRRMKALAIAAAEAAAEAAASVDSKAVKSDEN